MVFRLAISFWEISVSSPSRENNSLKCIIAYLPRLCKIWHDWYSLFSFLDEIPIRVRVSRTFKKSSFSFKVTSTPNPLKMSSFVIVLLFHYIISDITIYSLFHFRAFSIPISYLCDVFGSQYIHNFSCSCV